MKVLINTGVRTVYYDRPYKLQTIEDLLKHANLNLVQVRREDSDGSP
jgi:dCMP deaminase